MVRMGASLERIPVDHRVGIGDRAQHADRGGGIPSAQCRPSYCCSNPCEADVRRMLKTADEIQAEVSRLIQESDVVKSDGEHVHVSRPVLLPPCAEQDGCNWTMRTFGNASAYQPEVAQALAAVRAKWNLNA